MATNECVRCEARAFSTTGDLLGAPSSAAEASSSTAAAPSSWIASHAHLFRIIGAFAAVYLIWGSTFLGIRFAIETIPPMLMAGVRWTFAGGALFAFLIWRGAARPGRRDGLTAALIGGGIIFGGNGSVTYAEQFIPSGTVAVIVAVVPALMAVMGWLSGATKRPRIAVWCGIVLATWGVVVIVRPSGFSIGGEQSFAIGVLLVGELMWSAASLYAVGVRQRTSGLLMAAMQMLCGGAFMLATGGVRGEFAQFDPAAVTAQSLWALAYLASIGSIIGFSAYLWLLRNVDATRVATYAYVNPIVAVFLGSMLGGEVLAPELLGGSALVVLGIALIVTFRPKTLPRPLCKHS